MRARIWISVGLVAALGSAPARAGPLEQGRAHFFAGNFVVAHGEFETALATLPKSDDEAAHAFRAITRLLWLVERNEEGSRPRALDSLKEVLDGFGFAAAGRTLLDWSALPPQDPEGHVLLPADSPGGGRLQSYLENEPLPAIEDSLEDLAALSESFIISFSENEVEQLFGVLGQVYRPPQPLTIAWAEMKIVETGLHLARAKLLLFTAYDLDVDVDELLDPEFVFDLQANVLDPHPALLTLLPSGASALSELRSALVAAIDAYVAASASVRSRGECCLVYVDGEQLIAEERLRGELDELRGALLGCSVHSYLAVDVDPCALLGGNSSSPLVPRQLLPPFQFEPAKSPDVFASAAHLPDPTFGGLFPQSDRAVATLVMLSAGVLRPENDGWDAPVVINLGELRFGSLAGASQDGDSLEGDGADVWYRFTAVSPGFFRIETCSEGSEDTISSVHAAAPGTVANQIPSTPSGFDFACEDGFGSSGSTVVQLSSGQEVSIRVFDPDNDSDAPVRFTLRVPEAGAHASGLCAAGALGTLARRRR